MPRTLADSPVATRWLALIVLTALMAGVLAAVRLSAAPLIGAMAAAIILTAFDAGVRVPQFFFVAAQAIVGVMIARVMVASIFHEMSRDWPLFLGAGFAVIAAACGLGMLLTRWRVLPGTTALWGSFPGAATTMTLMAEAYGGDMRLVAFMQYLRVMIVAIVASGVARLWVSGTPAARPAWFPPIHPCALLETLAIAGGGAGLGYLLRVPAGPLLVPMILGALFQDLAGVMIELPPALLVSCYAIVGWGIGQRFTREILRHAARALPRVAGSILALIAVCCLFGGALVRFAGIDPLTAYLATSPGGADSVAIIAASSKVDMPFVMSLQVTRFVVILLLGPSLARFLAARVPAVADPGSP